MKTIAKLATAAMIGALLIAPAWSQSASDGIAAASKTFAAAFNAGDGTAVAAHYTEAGVLLPPAGKRVDGREAIAAFWQGAIKNGFKNFKLETVEVDSRQDLAVEVGSFWLDVPGDGGALKTIEGKYVVVWKQGSDGKWRLHRDIWNTGAAK